MLWLGDRVARLHIGDSRAFRFRFRDGQLRQLPRITPSELGAGERIRTADLPLQEARPPAPHALTAQTARVIALTALGALGLSEGSFHEPFHAQGLVPYHPATVRNLAERARAPVDAQYSSLGKPCRRRRLPFGCACGKGDQRPAAVLALGAVRAVCGGHPWRTRSSPEPGSSAGQAVIDEQYGLWFAGPDCLRGHEGGVTSSQLNAVNQSQGSLQARFGDAWQVSFVPHATGGDGCPAAWRRER